MVTLKSDVIECWYFNTGEDADEFDIEKMLPAPVGYDLIIDNVLKHNEGKQTEHTYICSKTEVIL